MRPRRPRGEVGKPETMATPESVVLAFEWGAGGCSNVGSEKVFKLSAFLSRMTARSRQSVANARWGKILRSTRFPRLVAAGPK